MPTDAQKRRFGRIIKRRRAAQALSQLALGRACQLHPTYICLVERGLRDPKLGTVRALAEGLGTTMAALMLELEKPRTRSRL